MATRRSTRIGDKGSNREDKGDTEIRRYRSTRRGINILIMEFGDDHTTITIVIIIIIVVSIVLWWPPRNFIMVCYFATVVGQSHRQTSAARQGRRRKEPSVALRNGISLGPWSSGFIVMGIRRRRRRREVIGKCSSFRCNACTAVVSASAAAVVAVELNFAIKIWPPEQNWADTMS